jgi:hypothetical protein
MVMNSIAPAEALETVGVRGQRAFSLRKYKTNRVCKRRTQSKVDWLNSIQYEVTTPSTPK